MCFTFLITYLDSQHSDFDEKSTEAFKSVLYLYITSVRQLKLFLYYKYKATCISWTGSLVFWLIK
jgi:hypothetical protein